MAARIRIVVYLTADWPAAGEVMAAIRQVAGQHGGRTAVAVHRRLEEMIAGLLRAVGEPPPVAVIGIGRQEEFVGLSAVRRLFVDLPLLLILADDNPDLVRFAHQLSPRFLCQAPCGVGELKLVLATVLARQGKTGS